MDKYEILNTLGVGSFGTVYKALKKQTNEFVAIKKFSAKFHSLEKCKELREVKALTKLDCEHIIKLKDIILEESKLYLVFELMDQNLIEFLTKQQEEQSRLRTPNDFDISNLNVNSIGKKKFKGIPEEIVKNIMFQTISGVSYMHKFGYFHRDLKPENILIDENFVIKLADFGLAREIRSIPPYTQYVSTRWYRAPECLLESSNYSFPIDIWALGCIMAELLSGFPLFPGSSQKDTLMKINSVLGPPSKGSEIDKLAKWYDYKFPSISNQARMDFASLFPEQTSKTAVELIESMLKWEPLSRPTTTALLSNSYFSDIKNMRNTKNTASVLKQMSGNNSNTNNVNISSISNIGINNLNDDIYLNKKSTFKYFESPKIIPDNNTTEIDIDKILESSTEFNRFISKINGTGTGTGSGNIANTGELNTLSTKNKNNTYNNTYNNNNSNLNDENTRRDYNSNRNHNNNNINKEEEPKSSNRNFYSEEVFIKKKANINTNTNNNNNNTNNNNNDRRESNFSVEKNKEIENIEENIFNLHTLQDKYNTANCVTNFEGTNTFSTMLAGGEIKNKESNNNYLNEKESTNRNRIIYGNSSNNSEANYANADTERKGNNMGYLKSNNSSANSKKGSKRKLDNTCNNKHNSKHNSKDKSNSKAKNSVNANIDRLNTNHIGYDNNNYDIVVNVENSAHFYNQNNYNTPAKIQSTQINNVTNGNKLKDSKNSNHNSNSNDLIKSYTSNNNNNREKEYDSNTNSNNRVSKPKKLAFYNNVQIEDDKLYISRNSRNSHLNKVITDDDTEFIKNMKKNLTKIQQKIEAQEHMDEECNRKNYYSLEKHDHNNTNTNTNAYNTNTNNNNNNIGSSVGKRRRRNRKHQISSATNSVSPSREKFSKSPDLVVHNYNHIYYNNNNNNKNNNNNISTTSNVNSIFNNNSNSNENKVKQLNPITITKKNISSTYESNYRLPNTNTNINSNKENFYYYTNTNGEPNYELEGENPQLNENSVDEKVNNKKHDYNYSKLSYQTELKARNHTEVNYSKQQIMNKKPLMPLAVKKISFERLPKGESSSGIGIVETIDTQISNRPISTITHKRRLHNIHNTTTNNTTQLNQVKNNTNTNTNSHNNHNHINIKFSNKPATNKLANNTFTLPSSFTYNNSNTNTNNNNNDNYSNQIAVKQLHQQYHQKNRDYNDKRHEVIQKPMKFTSDSKKDKEHSTNNNNTTNNTTNNNSYNLVTLNKLHNKKVNYQLHESISPDRIRAKNSSNNNSNLNNYSHNYTYIDQNTNTNTNNVNYVNNTDDLAINQIKRKNKGNYLKPINESRESWRNTNRVNEAKHNNTNNANNSNSNQFDALHTLTDNNDAKERDNTNKKEKANETSRNNNDNNDSNYNNYNYNDDDTDNNQILDSKHSKSNYNTKRVSNNSKQSNTNSNSNSNSKQKLSKFVDTNNNNSNNVNVNVEYLSAYKNHNNSRNSNNRNLNEAKSAVNQVIENNLIDNSYLISKTINNHTNNTNTNTNINNKIAADEYISINTNTNNTNNNEYEIKKVDQKFMKRPLSFANIPKPKNLPKEAYNTNNNTNTNNIRNVNTLKENKILEEAEIMEQYGYGYAQISHANNNSKLDSNLNNQKIVTTTNNNKHIIDDLIDNMNNCDVYLKNVREREKGFSGYSALPSQVNRNKTGLKKLNLIEKQTSLEKVHGKVTGINNVNNNNVDISKFEGQVVHQVYLGNSNLSNFGNANNNNNVNNVNSAVNSVNNVFPEINYEKIKKTVTNPGNLLNKINLNANNNNNNKNDENYTSVNNNNRHANNFNNKIIQGGRRNMENHPRTKYINNQDSNKNNQKSNYFNISMPYYNMNNNNNNNANANTNANNNVIYNKGMKVSSNKIKETIKEDVGINSIVNNNYNYNNKYSNYNNIPTTLDTNQFTNDQVLYVNPNLNYHANNNNYNNNNSQINQQSRGFNSHIQNQMQNYESRRNRVGKQVDSKLPNENKKTNVQGVTGNNNNNNNLTNENQKRDYNQISTPYISKGNVTNSNNVNKNGIFPNIGKPTSKYSDVNENFTSNNNILKNSTEYNDQFDTFDDIQNQLMKDITSKISKN